MNIISAVKGNSEINVKGGIESGSNVNIKDADGWTPLHWACHYGYVEIAKLLLKAGAVANIKNKQGKTPLDVAHESSSNSKYLIERLLISSGAICDKTHYGSPGKRLNVVGSGTTDQTCATDGDPNDSNAKFDWFDTNRKFGVDKIQKAQAAKVDRVNNQRELERIKNLELNKYYQELKPKCDALIAMIEEYKSDITNSIIEVFNKGELLTNDTVKLSDIHVAQLQNAYKEIIKCKTNLIKKESIINNLRPYNVTLNEEYILNIQNQIKEYGKSILENYLKDFNVRNPKTNNLFVENYNDMPSYIGYDFYFDYNNEHDFNVYPGRRYQSILKGIFDPTFKGDDNIWALDNYNKGAMLKARDVISKQQAAVPTQQAAVPTQQAAVPTTNEQNKGLFGGLWGGKTKRKRCKKWSRRNKRTNRCKRTNTKRKL